MILEALFIVALALVAYPYLVYPLLLYALTRNRDGPAPPPPAVELPPVTVITSVYNEAAVIVDKVKNLLCLKYPTDRVRIVIASDGSQDDTVPLARNASQGHAHVEIIDFETRRGKASVLHDLVTRAQTDIVALSDANTFFEPEALERLTRWFSDPEVGCVCGHMELIPAVEGSRNESMYWTLETRLKQWENRVGAVLGANGGIYAFRRDAYEPIAENTITDDFVLPMLIRKRGYRIVYDSTAVATEETAPTISHEFKRRTRIGAGNLQALSWTRDLLRPSAGWTAFTYWSHKVARWVAPILLVSAFLIALTQMDAPFYRGVAIVGMVLLAVALTGWLLERAGRRVPQGLAAPYAFVALNLALVAGAVQFIRGKQYARWSRTPRGTESAGP
ncbi:MAG: glycosyltransferase [Gammaproteobacteria bacterium]|uniref:Glycosyltransferase family 2 protein n=1 Tax=Candidatus Kutchimonas denitrificans TaxID=3056748 RepID=A0AAE5CB07_9BACT|nr:glycosyltransferase family 2 protein [Gemmatimonadota bacterium]NIR75167.1 glycosyltransferase family 2 protein [Candidatus Kutchimonas denitrificans]NIU52977.1 glycosyltransferase [Gemmatimonadota bacterium]NIV52446.1 glycosyltransferase [Gammaproteobacteria bacterium]NIY44866.1 glycosyltransferase [Gemmatimonadota bacterium]